MKKHQNKRWRLFCDARIQSNLCVRVGVYWFGCQLVTLAAVIGLQWVGGNDKPYLATFLVSLFFLPVVLLDIIGYSNRFIGPIINLRRWSSALADGEQVEKLRLRPGDYHSEIASNLNRLLEQRANTVSDLEAANIDAKPG